MKIIDRLDMYMKEKSLNDNQVTVQLGLSIGLLGKARREGGDLGKKSIEKILSFYTDLNRVWLLTGEGEMFSKGESKMNETKPKAIPAEPFDGDAIPLLETSIEAGVLKGFSESQIKNQLPHYRVPGFKGADFLATVSGDSMTDRYWPGDVVGCKIITSSGFIQWGKVHVLDTTQGGLLKRIMPSEKDGFIKAVSFNEKNYPSFEIPQSEITGLALVIGVVRLV